MLAERAVSCCIAVLQAVVQFTDFFCSIKFISGDIGQPQRCSEHWPNNFEFPFQSMFTFGSDFPKNAPRILGKEI